MKVTKGNEFTIHQCLYGYDDGHRLLSSSLVLDYKVQLELLKKSDIAPNMSEMPKDGYYSGFPIAPEKKYAIMRTWEAPEMSRPGCVWSHVLLISFSDLEFISNLECLENLFKRPDKNRDNLSIYSSPLSVKNNDFYIPAITMNDSKFLEVINSIYGNSSRQPFIHSLNPRDYIFDVYIAWSQQWPKLRRTFTFNTVGRLSNNSRELYKKNDLVFVVDKNSTLNVSSESDWNKKLVQWMELENLELKEFLWSFGSFFRDGRKKFHILLQLYQFARKKNELTSFDSLFSILNDSILESAEVLYSLEYFLPRNSHKKNNGLVNFTYNVIHFFPNYYKYFNDELLLQFSLGEMMKSLTKNEIEKLLTAEFLNSGYEISSAILEQADISFIWNVALKDSRLIDHVLARRSDAMLIDDFYSLPDEYIINWLDKHWSLLNDHGKFKVAENACYDKRLHILSVLMARDFPPLLHMFISNKSLVSTLYKSSYKYILIDFLLANINSVMLTENEMFVSDMLISTEYNEKVVDSLPVHSVVNILNTSVNDLNEINRFNLFSFVYYRLYLNDEDYALPAMAISFIELHHLLSKNVGDSYGWKMLNEIIPRPIKNREWDECMRLRLSIIRFCQKKPDAARNILGLIKDDKQILKKIFSDLMDYISNDSNFYFPKL